MGNKLQKRVYKFNISETTTQYANGYVYEKHQSLGLPPPGQPAPKFRLQFFSHLEGYVSAKDQDDYTQGFDYVYQYRDHLGNVRLSYQDINNDGSIDASTEIIEESNYYPFGLRHKGYNNVVNGTHHPYDYQGKENQEELGLNWHDFGARNYDAALGRWMNVDPLAEDTGYPYAAMNNNPISLIDPTGMAAVDWYNDADGNYVYDSNINSQEDLDNAGIEGTYLGESVNITVNGGDNVTLNEDGSVSAGGETYSSQGGSSIDFNWQSGHQVYSGGENAGNAKNNYYSSLLGGSSSLFGGTNFRDAAMVSYGASGFSSIPFPKSWLASTPSWFHGGYGRGWTKGSKFTSIGSFGYRRLTGGGNAGRAIPGVLGGIGTGLMWGDALLTGMMIESDARINALYDANNASNPYSGFVFRGAGLLRIDWQGISERRAENQRRYRENQKNNKYRGFVFD